MWRIFIFVAIMCGFIRSLLALPQALSPEDARYTWMDQAILENFSLSNEQTIKLENLEKVWNFVKQDQDNFARYQIIDSTVYGPAGSIYNFLNVLVKLYKVPNVDFIYHHGDGYHSELDAPCLTASTKKNTPNAILFTDRMFEISRTDVGWNAWIKKINAAQSLWPWEKRIEKAFWRGYPTNQRYGVRYNTENWFKWSRGQAVYLSHYVCPDEIDASFVPFGEVSDLVENYQDFIRSVPVDFFLSPDDLLRYKYHINLEGATCSYPGYQWRLLTGSLVFKQESNDEVQWFYYFLKPWVHYVPVQADLSDLVEKIRWAKTHDQEAKQIGENSRHFAMNNLMPEHFLLYCYKVLVFYAALQDFSPEPYLEHQQPHHIYGP